MFRTSSLIFFLLSFSLIVFIAKGEELFVKVPLILENSEIGVVTLFPQGKKFSILSEDIITHLSPELNASAIKDLIQKVGSKKKITKAGLDALAIKFIFNEDDLLIYIEIPPELRRATELSLTDNFEYDGPGLFRGDPYSGFLNFSGVETYHQDADQNNFGHQNFASYLENVHQIKGHVLEVASEYQSENKAQPWQLDKTRYIYDDQKKMIRYMAMDLEFPRRGHQNFNPAFGVGATRNFSLNPHTLFKSTSSNTLFIKRPSFMEVYLNNSLIKKLQVPAGPLTLSDYPFLSGKNDITIKIIDDRGQEEKIELTELFHPDLLGKGKNEFSYNVYAKPTTVGFKKNIDSHQLGSSAFFRRGVLNSLTLGMLWQHDRYSQIAGPEINWLHRFGVFSFFPTLSHDQDNLSRALKIQYSSIDQWGEKLSPVFARSNLDVEQSTFREVGLLSDQKRVSFDWTLGLRVFDFSSIGIGTNYIDRYNLVDTHTARLLLTKSFSVAWQSTLEFKHNLQGEKENAVQLTVTWQDYQNRLQNFTSYNSEYKSANTLFRKRFFEGDKKLDGTVGMDYLEKNKSYFGGLDLSTARGDWRWDHRANDRLNEKTTHTGNVSYRGAVAWTNHGVGFGRAVQDAFVIVKGAVPKKGSVHIGKNAEYAEYHLDGLGPALLPQQLDYQIDRFYLLPENLPPGISLNKEEYVGFLRYHQGKTITVNFEEKFPLSLKITNTKHRPIEYESITILDQNKNPIAEGFSNKEGLVFVESLAPGLYTLEVGSGDYRPTALQINQLLEGNFYEAGVLVLQNNY